MAVALVEQNKALKMLEQEKQVVKRTLAEVVEQKAINDYVVHDKDQQIEAINKELAAQKAYCQKLQDKRVFNDTMEALHIEIAELKNKVDALNKQNEVLEKWGKRLAIEATQELTGNKPEVVIAEKFTQHLVEGQPKTIAKIWESGDISKLKVVEKNRGPVKKKAVRVNKWA
jgi:hypothetical protein